MRCSFSWAQVKLCVANLRGLVQSSRPSSSPFGQAAFSAWETLWLQLLTLIAQRLQRHPETCWWCQHHRLHLLHSRRGWNIAVHAVMYVQCMCPQADVHLSDCAGHCESIFQPLNAAKPLGLQSLCSIYQVYTLKLYKPPPHRLTIWNVRGGMDRKGGCDKPEVFVEWACSRISLGEVRGVLTWRQIELLHKELCNCLVIRLRGLGWRHLKGCSGKRIVEHVQDSLQTDLSFQQLYHMKITVH